MASNDIGGVWRTVGGRRIFIRDGSDLPTAMKESGKFNKSKSFTKEGKSSNMVAKEEKGKELREKLKKIDDDSIPDGTYNLETGEKVDFHGKGFNVSFEQSSDNYSNAQYYEKCEECRNLCDGNIYAGKFGGSPEVSFYTTDRKTAEKIAIKYNQHSYYDNEIEDVVENPHYVESKNKVNYKGKGR